MQISILTALGRRHQHADGQCAARPGPGPRLSACAVVTGASRQLWADAAQPPSAPSAPGAAGSQGCGREGFMPAGTSRGIRFR